MLEKLDALESEKENDYPEQSDWLFNQSNSVCQECLNVLSSIIECRDEDLGSLTTAQDFPRATPSMGKLFLGKFLCSS